MKHMNKKRLKIFWEEQRQKEREQVRPLAEKIAKAIVKCSEECKKVSGYVGFHGLFRAIKDIKDIIFGRNIYVTISSYYKRCSCGSIILVAFSSADKIPQMSIGQNIGYLR